MSKYLSLALCFGLYCQLAIANDATFEALDGDADGSISAQEARASSAVADAFGRLDVNGDGVLSEAEYSVIEMSKGG